MLNMLKYQFNKIGFSIRKRLFGHARAMKGMSRTELQKYWAKPVGRGDAPDKYAAASERTEYLCDLLSNHAPSARSALEIGCNVGRNLEGLRQSGFSPLAGIEISEAAIKSMRETYPDLHAMVKIFNVPVEDCIKSIEPESYDLVFSMAVLLHIHPDSEWIFDEMCRIAKTNVVIIEAQSQRNYKTFQRDYRSEFTRRGLTEVFSETTPMLAGYTTYVFRK